jgi:hypothetical protein
MISANLRIVAIAGSLALLVFVVELVRRRRLKEEYSVLWVATALALLLLAVWGALLRDLAHLIGAGSQASTLYFFGILFVVFVLLHFSVRVSNLERKVVVLLQEVALLTERESRAHTSKEATDTSRTMGMTGLEDGLNLVGDLGHDRGDRRREPVRS